MRLKLDSRTARDRRIAHGREEVRTRLRAFEYVRRLREIAERCDTAEPAQIPAMRLKADIFLRLLGKVLPDLKAIEHSGHVEHRTVEEMTDAELLAIIAAGRGQPTADESGERSLPAPARPTVN
jgi:hypothetical protein